MAEKKASSWSEQEFFGLEITGVEETGKELGRGAYGVVQEAVWWGTKCVTKRLHNILSVEAQSKHSKDFLTECFTWSRLRHPHIVQFLGLLFEKDSPLPVLVLEKLSTSLRRHLERSSRSEFLLRDKVTVLHHVILGLAYLHSLKHIHRDLTTNNILIDTLNWHAKISDFGVTRVLADERIKQTTSTIVPGAEAFMAPEAFELLSQFSCEFDVFSYGCVMVSTVSHCWPQPSAAKKKINGKLVALTELERRETYIDQFTSEEKELFAGVIERCLEEEAKDRPTSLSLVEEISHLRSSFEQVDTLEEKYEEAMAMNKKLEEELEGVHGEIEKARTELEELRESSKLLERGKEELVEAQEEFTANLIRENEQLEENVKMLEEKLKKIQEEEAPETHQENGSTQSEIQANYRGRTSGVDHNDTDDVLSGGESEPSGHVESKHPEQAASGNLLSRNTFHGRPQQLETGSQTVYRRVSEKFGTAGSLMRNTSSGGAILFHRKGERFYEFNPWYPAPVAIEGKQWPSSENYYLVRRFEGSPLESAIRDCRTPQDTYKLTRTSDTQKHECNNWDRTKHQVMSICQENKFEQHPELQELLMSTGNRELVYHTRTDSFRGDGGDGSGENQLGKKLMEIRSNLHPFSLLS